MPEYIKLKSALRILDNVMSDEGIKHKGKAIRKRLKELPGEDVVEIKDCCQCKHVAKHAGQYPCSHCRNCYTDKFEKKEGAEE